MIENILINKGYYFLRIDGNVKPKDRGAIVEQFQTDKRWFVFLLTTQVSGVGLNICGADRAIVLDPDWNPANDNQSIDRCYRIGQKRDVIIYRLISTNSVEDKIFQRQVYKSSLDEATMNDNKEKMVRYFVQE